MWIKSQDKKTLVNANDLFIVDLSIEAVEADESKNIEASDAVADFSIVTATNSISTDKYTVLGSYTSEARALAVMSMIELKISSGAKINQTIDGITCHGECIIKMPTE